MTDRTLLTRAELLAKLNQNEKWFTRYRLRLETQHGFPRAIPPTYNRWDPVAVNRWLDGLAPGATQQHGPASLTINLEYMRDELRQRSRKIAAGARR